MLRCTMLLAAFSVIVMTGCGSKSNAVTGKVTYNGQPVTGGSLTFLPVTSSAGDPQAAGKPAAANVDSAGNYKLIPGGDSGGAAKGMNRVVYSAPVSDIPAGVELQPGQGPAPSPFDGLRPKTETVEVKPGNNTIDIELTK
jgi:hypothetical protein